MKLVWRVMKVGGKRDGKRGMERRRCCIFQKTCTKTKFGFKQTCWGAGEMYYIKAIC